MKWAHNTILTSMHDIYACFEGGSSEVKREWRTLVTQTDSDIEVGGECADEDLGAECPNDSMPGYLCAVVVILRALSRAEGLKMPLQSCHLLHLQHALRNTVKKSLQQLSKAINGDAKTDPQTLFKVTQGEHS